MQRNPLTLISILAVVIVTACSTTSSNVKPPPIAFAGGTITKEITPDGDLGRPSRPTDSFANSDEKAIYHARFDNFSGNYRLRWDWYNPNGNLYSSSGDYPVATTEGKYRRALTAWHAIGLRGQKAAEMLGEWSVRLYVNDDLVDTQTFMLTATDRLHLPDDLSSSPDPAKWALVIGIENYANLPDADYALKDALVVKEYFIRVFGVPEYNIILLTDNKATKAGLKSYIREYLPKNLDEDTDLYVYFAGHGAPEIQTGDAYLVPYDGDTRFLETTGYSLKTFYADLDSIGNKRTYIFLDACFSGVASRAAEMLAKGTRPALLHVENTRIGEESAEHLMSMSSSSAGEPSHAYPQSEHGLFTYFLLKGIGGEADLNTDGVLNVDEVYNYVFTHVSREARRMGSEQKPVITPSISSFKNVPIVNVPR